MRLFQQAFRSASYTACTGRPLHAPQKHRIVYVRIFHDETYGPNRLSNRPRPLLFQWDLETFAPFWIVVVEKSSGRCTIAVVDDDDLLPRAFTPGVCAMESYRDWGPFSIWVCRHHQYQRFHRILANKNVRHGHVLGLFVREWQLVNLQHLITRRTESNPGDHPRKATRLSQPAARRVVGGIFILSDVVVRKKEYE
jgi:hypothetical protein